MHLLLGDGILLPGAPRSQLEPTPGIADYGRGSTHLLQVDPQPISLTTATCQSIEGLCTHSFTHSFIHSVILKGDKR